MRNKSSYNNWIQDLNEDELFQYDSAPCQRLHATQRLGDGGVTILKDWAAQSPDLSNIMEMQTELKRRVCLKNLCNFDEL